MLCSVIEHGRVTLFCFQTAQKNSASLRSSVRQFEKLNDVTPCSITEQCTPSYVLTVLLLHSQIENRHLIGL